jgi:hypothetical protein
MSHDDADFALDDSADPALAALRRGRELQAPPDLWPRIARAARPQPLSWPIRIAAIAAGALLWIAGVRAFDRPHATGELPDHLIHQIDAAAPYLLEGSLASQVGNELAAHTEVRLLETLLSSPELPQ